MTYVALLRGINVGGNHQVEMKKLAEVVGNLGVTSVTTYINSGNVIFNTTHCDVAQLANQLELAISSTFGFEVPVVVCSLSVIEQICNELPNDWANDQSYKCDILFLWPTVDEQTLPTTIGSRAVDRVIFLPGAVLWLVARNDLGKSGLLKLVGTQLYKQMTIRNCNTVRKLLPLMQRADQLSS